MSKRIVALPGDGIGAEIMDSALKILAEIMLLENLDFDIQQYPFRRCRH
jgi:3-isopropylmalate dehydrogenase